MVRSPSPPHSGVEVRSHAGYRRLGRPRVGGGSYASNVAKTGTVAASWGGNEPADVIERQLRSRPRLGIAMKGLAGTGLFARRRAVGGTWRASLSSPGPASLPQAWITLSPPSRGLVGSAVPALPSWLAEMTLPGELA